MANAEHKINNIKTLGEVIRKYRESLGLSQEDAAGLLGVSRKLLSELENGKKETMQIGKVLQVLQRMGLEVRVVAKEKR